LFILYAFHIQSGFATAWEIERLFWRRVVELCPDITPKTRVILVGTEPRQNEFILSNSWADPLVLGEIFTWKPGPVFFYYDGMASAADIRFEDGQITWKPLFWGDDRETLDQDEVILLQDNGEEITRTMDFQMPGLPVTLHSKELAPAQPDHSPVQLSDFGRFLLRP